MAKLQLHFEAHVVRNIMKPYKGSKACEQVYPSGLHYHHPTTFVGVPAAIAMTAAVPSTSASLLPASAARPLAGSTVSFGASYQKRRKIPAWRVRCSADDEEEVKDLGVNVALSMLKFYKREISPLLPSSCRYVPTCSEYSMQAYKRYGVVKGTILTAWRLCRCNPLGGYGYDPPRWFGEEDLPLQ